MNSKPVFMARAFINPPKNGPKVSLYANTSENALKTLKNRAIIMLLLQEEAKNEITLANKEIYPKLV